MTYNRIIAVGAFHIYLFSTCLLIKILLRNTRILRIYFRHAAIFFPSLLNIICKNGKNQDLSFILPTYCTWKLYGLFYNQIRLIKWYQYVTLLLYHIINKKEKNHNHLRLINTLYKNSDNEQFKHNFIVILWWMKIVLNYLKAFL